MSDSIYMNVSYGETESPVVRKRAPIAAPRLSLSQNRPESTENGTETNKGDTTDGTNYKTVTPQGKNDYMKVNSHPTLIRAKAIDNDIEIQTPTPRSRLNTPPQITVAAPSQDTDIYIYSQEGGACAADQSSDDQTKVTEGNVEDDVFIEEPYGNIGTEFSPYPSQADYREAAGRAKAGAEGKGFSNCCINDLLDRQESIEINPLSSRSTEPTIPLNRLSTAVILELDLLRKTSTTADPTKQYKFKKFIGEGGYGKVYYARNREYSEDAPSVAVKCLNLAKDIQNLKFVRQEVYLLKSLDHPNIVRLLDTHMIENTLQLCLVLEYINGLALNEILEPRQGTGISQESLIAAIIRPCLSAIHYIHDKNAMHRDIKSDNVMVSMEGVVKLIDFGVSVKSENTGKRITRAGTSYWMAPEIIKGSPYTNKIDIWSLGIMTYECFKGVPPHYEYEIPAQAERMILRNGVEKHIKQLSMASSNLRKFLTRCCHKNDSRRADAKELIPHPFLRDYAKKDQLSRYVIQTKEEWYSTRLPNGLLTR